MKLKIMTVKKLKCVLVSICGGLQTMSKVVLVAEELGQKADQSSEGKESVFVTFRNILKGLPSPHMCLVVLYAYAPNFLWR